MSNKNIKLSEIILCFLVNCIHSNNERIINEITNSGIIDHIVLCLTKIEEHSLFVYESTLNLNYTALDFINSILKMNAINLNENVINILK